MISRAQIINLDNNATTQLDPAVIEEMLPYLTEYYGNPSSGYLFGRQVRQAIDLARERVAALLGCEPVEIVFTSCGTESNNAAVNSALQLDPARQHVVTTAVEHSATRRHCETLAQGGRSVSVVGVDGEGNLDLAELENAITPQTAIVTAMWANNETGVLFPVEKIAEIARRKRVLFHTDAIQTAGKIPIRLADSRITSLALSAHKLHGPKGVGALYVNKRCAFKPSLIGGSQEGSRRAGTENVAGIVGFGVAAELAVADLAGAEKTARLRDEFERGALSLAPGAIVLSARVDRLPNTSCLAVPGVKAETLVIGLDLAGIAVGAGSACSSGKVEASHVLAAMGLSDELARGAIRVSLGFGTSRNDINTFLKAFGELIGRLRPRVAA